MSKVKNNPEQFIEDIRKNISKYGRCYPNHIDRVLLYRYGVQDLAEWIELDNMMEMLAEVDPDIKYMWNTMLKHEGLESRGLFKGVNLKDMETRKYCYTLLIRLDLKAALQGVDIEDLEEIQDIEEGELENAI